MTELRLTFASEGLAAVSQVLVDMGISFRVEPVGPAAQEEGASEAAAPVRRQAPAKPARKSSRKARRAAPRPEKPQAEETPAAGAERLRAAIARGGAGYRSPLESPPSPAEPSAPAGGGQSDDPSGAGTP